MKNYLFIAQIFVSVFLIVSILLQKRGTALGSALGGGGASYFTRRGFEKKIFWSTCISGGLFIILALLNLVL
jgi:protein translocase SecG subunit